MSKDMQLLFSEWILWFVD